MPSSTIYPLSLHDALPICGLRAQVQDHAVRDGEAGRDERRLQQQSCPVHDGTPSRASQCTGSTVESGARGTISGTGAGPIPPEVSHAVTGPVRIAIPALRSSYLPCALGSVTP